MSVNLSIKGVPEALAARLRARAEKNHRSLQGELMAIISRAADSGSSAAFEAVRSSEPIQRGGSSMEQIGATLRSRFPAGVAQAPRAADILRELREGR